MRNYRLGQVMVVTRYIERVTDVQIGGLFVVDHGCYQVFGHPHVSRNNGGWKSADDFYENNKRRKDFMFSWDGRCYFNQMSAYGISSFQTVHFEER